MHLKLTCFFKWKNFTHNFQNDHLKSWKLKKKTNTAARSAVMSPPRDLAEVFRASHAHGHFVILDPARRSHSQLRLGHELCVERENTSTAKSRRGGRIRVRRTLRRHVRKSEGVGGRDCLVEASALERFPALLETHNCLVDRVHPILLLVFSAEK